MAEKKPVWESVISSLCSVITALGAIAVPIVVAVLGHVDTEAAKNREIERKFVELTTYRYTNRLR